jgi:hypothetical protein
MKRGIILGSRISTAVFWIGAAILFAYWVLQIVFPFAEAAGAYQNLHGVSVVEAFGIEFVINGLFGNIIFILMVVFAIIGLPFGIITFREYRRENKEKIAAETIESKY